MRWTTFERTEIYCRRTDPDGADCFEVRAIHEVTVSGYSLWSQYEICWRGDRIVRVERLGGGAHGG
ncbi:MAG: hypothetical protein HY908_30915 [Myxococcales bacterium]|nr:hypothetical protein [Myxococcales bacterium]